MAELHPEIWSELPQEILLLIINQSDRRTLVNWSETCSTYHAYSQERVQERLRVDYELREMETFIRLNLEKAPQAGSLVNHITIDIRGPDELPTYYETPQALSQISLLNQRWPEITSLTHQGLLPDYVLRDIIRFGRLRKLEVRTDGLRRPASPGQFDGERSIVTTQHSVMFHQHSLNGFTELSNLKWLQTLNVCHLGEEEAILLSRAIKALNLKSLEVSAIDFSSLYAQGLIPYTDSVDLHWGDSPVLRLVWSICTWPATGTNRVTFPLSLQRLVLRDHYQPESDRPITEDYHTLLINSLRGCNDLQSLEVDMPYLHHNIAPARDILSSMFRSRARAVEPKSMMEAMERLSVD